MLIRFNFKNYKSFKEENCLDMEATSIKEHSYNVVNINEVSLLKVAAIYGANASGKTNVLEAFDFMKRKVLINDDLKKTIPLVEESIYTYMLENGPISMEVEILANNNKIYKYGFEIENEKVISEWLYFKRKTTFGVIFERNNNKVEMKSSKIAGSINLDSESLFLNILNKIDKDNEDVNAVYDWYLNSLYLDLGNPNFENMINNKISNNIVSDSKYREELTKFIRTFDSGIVGLKTKPEKIEDIRNSNNYIEIEVLRKDIKGNIKALPFYLESNGTKKMFYLFDYIMNALSKGSKLFIDELDAKLHPILTRYIINLFHNVKTNKGNGQLIYSTHDTINLNKETFRRDEIWFTQKDDNGISELYSLSDYILDEEDGKKVRNDATYNKDYLTGRYGAIPILKEFDIDYEKEEYTIS